MAFYTQTIQQIYVAFFNRPADPGGLEFWEAQLEANNGDTSGLAASFASSAEYRSTFKGLSSDEIVIKVYMNLFGREPEPAGLAYWSLPLAQGKITIDQIVTQVAAGAQGSDLDAYNDKVLAATQFTDALTTVTQILSYSGDAANTVAKAYISTVTDAASLAIATANLPATLNAVAAAHDKPQDLTISLSTGIDSIAPSATQSLGGDDSFTANTVNSTNALSSFDQLDGGPGNNSLSVTDSVGAGVTPNNVTIKNIQTISVNSAGAVTLGASYQGLQKLTITAGGQVDTGNASGAAVVVDTTIGKNASQGVKVEGGTDVTVHSSGASTGAMDIGATAAVTGAVTVQNTTVGSANYQAGNITVRGGSTVSISQALADAPNFTATNGAVSVTGNGALKSVTVSNAATTTANAFASGASTNTVTIADGSSGGDTLTDVTATNFSALILTAKALSNLTLGGDAGSVYLNNTGGSATLNLNLSGASGLVLSEQGVLKTLNLTLSSADSSLNSISAPSGNSALTALNIGGSRTLTLGDASVLAALQTVSVVGSAGLKANLSVSSASSIDASATSGNNTLTIDASKASYAGGTGADTVTVSSAAVSKAINLGAGNDSLDLSKLVGALTTTIDGGGGTDSLTISTVALDAATLSGKVNNFENLTLTGGGTHTINLGTLGSLATISASGAADLTLQNLSPSSKLVLTGAGTEYDVSSANTGGSASVELRDGSNHGINFASTGLNLSGFNTLNLVVTDSQAQPSGTFQDSLTLLGSSLTSLQVSGTAGLTLDASSSSALKSVDASALTKGGFSFTDMTPASAFALKGSSTGANSITLGDGGGSVQTGSAADTITLGKGAYQITTGGGADTVHFTNAAASLSSFSTIADAHAGLQIIVPTLGTATFGTAQIAAGSATSVSAGADAVVQAGSDASHNSYFGWFQFNGDTYLVQSVHDGSSQSYYDFDTFQMVNVVGSFSNNTDTIIKLVGLLDLSHASVSGNTLTLH